MAITRRDLIRSTAAVGAASLITRVASAAPAPATTQAATTRANDRPGVGVIGTGGIARYKAQFTPAFGDIVASCDVDSARATAFNNDFSKGKGFVTGDYRKVLERTDVDVVFIDTPDHWHAKMAIDAMRAGKDVYCEKPLTLTIDEGRILCRVARETARVVQVGTQQRSDPRMQLAVALVHSGRLGRIRRVQAVLGDTPQKGKDFKPAPVPKELDWETWLGQAPRTPFMPQRCHHDFRWWYEYSGGLMTDWGAHHVDIAQLAVAPDLPGPTLVEPLEVQHPVPLVHGLPTVDDAYNTALKFNVRCAFANGVELFIRDSMKDFGADNGIRIEGEEGTIFVDRFKVTGEAVDALKDHPLPPDALPEPDPNAPADMHHRHMANFFACVRDRKTPTSDIFSHHRNLTTCHLANIAMRLGRRVRWDASAQEIIGDDEANSFQARPQRKGYEVA